MKMEITEKTELESFRWFKNQDFNILHVILRYFMGEVKFEVTGGNE